MRFLGCRSLEEAEDMTLPDYLYRYKAYRLRSVDEDYHRHLSAWLNVQAGSMKQQGDKQAPVYRTFKNFFDYQKRVEEIEKPQPKILSDRQRRMAQAAAQLNT